MNQALKLLEWPNQIDTASPNRKTTEGLTLLRNAFNKLSIFEHPLGSRSPMVSLPSNDNSGPLLPFKAMAKEIDIRFRFHFEGKRPTNKIEKVLVLRFLCSFVARMVFPTHFNHP